MFTSIRENLFHVAYWKEKEPNKTLKAKFNEVRKGFM